MEPCVGCGSHVSDKEQVFCPKCLADRTALTPNVGERVRFRSGEADPANTDVECDYDGQEATVVRLVTEDVDLEISPQIHLRFDDAHETTVHLWEVSRQS